MQRHVTKGASAARASPASTSHPAQAPHAPGFTSAGLAPAPVVQQMLAPGLREGVWPEQGILGCPHGEGRGCRRLAGSGVARGCAGLGCGSTALPRVQGGRLDSRGNAAGRDLGDPGASSGSPPFPSQPKAATRGSVRVSWGICWQLAAFITHGDAICGEGTEPGREAQPCSVSQHEEAGMGGAQPQTLQ